MMVPFDGDAGVVMQFSSIVQIVASQQGFLMKQYKSLWNKFSYVNGISRQTKNFRHLS